MKDVKFEGDYGGVDYNDLIETMEFSAIPVEESDNDYQGDTFMLVTKLDQIGVLTYGWGSCSGCDAAQAVSSQAEANQLRDDLYYGTRWFDTTADALAWVEDYNGQQLQWYGHSEAFKMFVQKAKEWLEANDHPSEDEIKSAVESILKKDGE